MAGKRPMLSSACCRRGRASIGSSATIRQCELVPSSEDPDGAPQVSAGRVDRHRGRETICLGHPSDSSLLNHGRDGTHVGIVAKTLQGIEAVCFIGLCCKQDQEDVHSQSSWWYPAAPRHQPQSRLANLNGLPDNSGPLLLSGCPRSTWRWLSCIGIWLWILHQWRASTCPASMPLKNNPQISAPLSVRPAQAQAPAG